MPPSARTSAIAAYRTPPCPVRPTNESLAPPAAGIAACDGSSDSNASRRRRTRSAGSAASPSVRTRTASSSSGALATTSRTTGTPSATKRVAATPPRRSSDRRYDVATAGASASSRNRSPSVWWLRSSMSFGSMQSRCRIRCASSTLPCSESSRAARKLAAAAGALRSSAFPSHTLASLSCSRSRSTPPNTIAPIRPFPTGSASVHATAGAAYHRSGGVPVIISSGRTAVRRRPTPIGTRRACTSGSITGSNEASPG